MRIAVAAVNDRPQMLNPMHAAALKVSEMGLMEALDVAYNEAEQMRTAFHDNVRDILNAVYENDPPQPNDCSECGRSFGPCYTGPCQH